MITKNKHTNQIDDHPSEANETKAVSGRGVVKQVDHGENLVIALN